MSSCPHAVAGLSEKPPGSHSSPVNTMLTVQPSAATGAAVTGRRVHFAFVGFTLLFILALIALLKCRREDIPELIRALAFWWRGWPRS